MVKVFFGVFFGLVERGWIVLNLVWWENFKRIDNFVGFIFGGL